MRTTKTISPVRQGQPATLGTRAELMTPGKYLGWRQGLWQWLVGSPPVGRRHRAPPRLEHVRRTHHNQVQQAATEDCLELLTQEKQALRVVIYTALWW